MRYAQDHWLRLQAAAAIDWANRKARAKVIDLVRTDPHMTIGLFCVDWMKTHGYQFSEIEKNDLRAYWNDIKKEAAR